MRKCVRNSSTTGFISNEVDLRKCFVSLTRSSHLPKTSKILPNGKRAPSFVLSCRTEEDEVKWRAVHFGFAFSNLFEVIYSPSHERIPNNVLTFCPIDEKLKATGFCHERSYLTDDQFYNYKQ